MEYVNKIERHYGFNLRFLLSDYFNTHPEKIDDDLVRNIRNLSGSAAEVTRDVILAYNFDFKKVISNDIEVYVKGDYTMYFNYNLKTMTLYEQDIDNKTTTYIIKKAAIENCATFVIIMNSLGFFMTVNNNKL